MINIIWIKNYFGVFQHKVIKRKEPLLRGFDDFFFAPHSRHSAINEEELKKCNKIEVLAYSQEANSTIIASKDKKKFFLTCHLEYEKLTLDEEFKRDKSKNMKIDIPVNYYPQNNINNIPNLTWKMASQLLFSNWINYYVYQESPYNVKLIGN